MADQATPRPWTFTRLDYNHWHIRGQTRDVGDLDTLDVADAVFVERAVNSFDAMRETIRRQVAYIETPAESLDIDGSERRSIYEQLKAALQLAEEGEV